MRSSIIFCLKIGQIIFIWIFRLKAFSRVVGVLFSINLLNCPSICRSDIFSGDPSSSKRLSNAQSRNTSGLCAGRVTFS